MWKTIVYERYRQTKLAGDYEPHEVSKLPIRQTIEGPQWKGPFPPPPPKKNVNNYVPLYYLTQVRKGETPPCSIGEM